MFKKFSIIVFGLVLFLGEVSQGGVLFSDDFGNGSLDGWVGIGSAGGSLSESGGKLWTPSGCFGLTPYEPSASYKLTTTIDFNGELWNEIYIRSDGTTDAYGGTPPGIRVAYWNNGGSTNSLSIYANDNDPCTVWIKLAGTRAIPGFNPNTKTYKFEIFDERSSIAVGIGRITAVMSEVGNPSNHVVTQS